MLDLKHFELLNEACIALYTQFLVKALSRAELKFAKLSVQS